MSSFKILFAFAFVATFQTTFAKNVFVGGPNISGCRKFTVDKCIEGSAYETIQGITDITSCQTYCSDIFTDYCQFFMLDLKQQVCYIMDQTMEDYVSTCKKVYGPRSPAFADCQVSPDPCDKFIEGYCQYEGNVLEHFNGLTVNKCQTSCVLNPGCLTWAYDATAGITNCELLGTVTSVSCDMIRGPKAPEYTTCAPSKFYNNY